MPLEALSLGASLYVPATRTDLVAIGGGQRYPALRSVIFCTEDSIRAEEVDTALLRLAEALPRLRHERGGPLRFIRPRNAQVLNRLLALPGIDAVDGFVLPKATSETVAGYLAVLGGARFRLMPTLETREAFDPGAVASLRILLERERNRVLALRIGGNDLLNLLGVRRRPDRTIYDTALGAVIANLVCAFRPFGFALTAPVFEGLGHEDVLRAEVEQDLDHGLIGKTAIHPAQVPVIESAYRVPLADLRMAREILADDAPAVFQLGGVMCEPATHACWARTTIERARIYDVAGTGGASHPEDRAAGQDVEDKALAQALA